MMTLVHDLLDFLRSDCRGKGRAITINELEGVVHGWGYRIANRDLRDLYAELGACSCSTGIYWPAPGLVGWAEVEECCHYTHKKAYGLFDRAKHLREVHKGLRAVRQLELPI